MWNLNFLPFNVKPAVLNLSSAPNKFRSRPFGTTTIGDTHLVGIPLILSIISKSNISSSFRSTIDLKPKGKRRVFSTTTTVPTRPDADVAFLRYISRLHSTCVRTAGVYHLPYLLLLHCTNINLMVDLHGEHSISERSSCLTDSFHDQC